MSAEPQPTSSSREAVRGVLTIPWEVPVEVIPDLEALVIEDDAPVDNIFAEMQQRLLTEPLYASWGGPQTGEPFQAFANVGLFFAAKEEPLAPDVMLVLGAHVGADLSVRENRSYYIWIMGKPPDVAIEIVSDRRGREDAYKRSQYARIGVPYYAIFDPNNRLKQGLLRCFGLHAGQYVPLEQPWFAGIQLGLTLWAGAFEGSTQTWLRWCDQAGNVVPTGKERADQERQRRERLEAQLRQLGIEPAP